MQAHEAGLDGLSTEKFGLVLPAMRQKLALVAAAVCLIAGVYFGVVVAPAGLKAAAPSVEKGLLPEWVGCREVLRGYDPYAPQVTREIERQFYLRSSRPGEVGWGPDQCRFAYPAFFAFLFLPIAVLPFEIAQRVALFVCVICAASSVFLWSESHSFKLPALLTSMAFFFASYPTVLAVQLRQPTVVFGACLAAMYWCVRTRRLSLAGILAAMSMAKPQLAAPVLAPVMIWAAGQWPKRRLFFGSMAVTLAGLLCASGLFVPRWILHWLAAVEAYAHYAGANPLLLEVLPRELYLPAVLVLALAVVWVSVSFRESDLLFAVSFSIAAAQLVFAFQLYNEVLLLPAILWMLQDARNFGSHHQLQMLLTGSVWTLVVMGWAGQAALSVASILSSNAHLALWQAPLVANWLLPWPIFVALAGFALANMRQLRANRTTRTTICDVPLGLNSPIQPDGRSAAQSVSR